MTGGWLDIDIKGFAAVLRNKGLPRILLEPISNALDTEAATIEVRFSQGEGKATLTVHDDDRDGFADLRDAYTLFAPSTRAADPTKRGRFGQGDKKLVAVCFAGGTVEVISTTGMIVFDKNGRRARKNRLSAGTTLGAIFRCNKAEAAEFERLVRGLIVPERVTLTFNDVEVPHRKPAHVVKASLPTKIVDDDGNLADATRRTEVTLYQPRDGEKPTIFELGVPVVEHDGRWHLDVGQKVPLNSARDNVPAAYLRRLRELMLNETFEMLTAAELKRPWVADALPRASDDALRDLVAKVHGDDAVIYDPSNQEASKRAVEEGRTVVYGRSFTPETWARVRDLGILKPAGQVIQTGIPASPEGRQPIPEAEWTDSMRDVAAYAKAVGRALLGFEPNVEFQNMTVVTVAGHAVAWWGNRTVTFNLGRLGKAWPTRVTGYDLDGLLIHEFAHQVAADHYSAAFYDECCRLGARLRDCPTRWREARP